MTSFSTRLRTGLVASGALLVIAGGVVGVAAAQQTPAPAPTQQARPAAPRQEAFLEALANRLGVTVDRLRQAMTEARADVGVPANGRGFGFGAPRGAGPRHILGQSLDVAAQAIGITADQLKQELPGKSLAQVAQAHGKSGADVATALKNAANQRIDQAVAAGRLTADQAAQQKQQVARRIDQSVNQVVPQGRPGPRGGGFHGGPRDSGRGFDRSTS